jgi:HD domain
MVLAGIKVTDTTLVRDAIELARSSLEPYLFNHVMRSWLFGILLSDGAELAPDPELLAVSAVLHDLGLTGRYTAEDRFEVDGANAARAFLKDRGISTLQRQVVWDAIALHTTPSIALHKEPEVAMTHSGIAVDVIGVGLDRIPQDKQCAVLTGFPRLAFKNQFQASLCNVVRRKPATSFDNVLRDFGSRYVEGFTAPSFADLFANAPFSE